MTRSHLLCFATALSAAVAACLPLGMARAADESGQNRVYTQAPQIAPSQVAGEAADQPDQPADTASLSGGPTPRWIWGPDENRRYVLQTTFDGSVKAARLKAACDNLMTVFVNGQRVGAGDNWQQPLEVDVTRHVQEGRNTLLAQVENQGGPAGFVLKLAITRPDDSVDYIVSDESWRAGKSADDADTLAVRSLGQLGDAPWGDVFSGAASVAGPPRDVFFTPPGFQVERLFTVPKEELGSWVCLVTDPQGRLIASDQNDRGLCRITPSPVGSDEPTRVERLDIGITAAQGMLFAFDSLYLSVNGGPGSGLYRARDTNGDDQFDEVVKLREFRGGGEHGPHALRLSPDGQSIYVVCGNHTQIPQDVIRDADPQTMGGPRPAQLRAELPPGLTSRIAPNWDEDLLLPRQWDGNGHAAGVLAPGGWIAQTDPNGESWELVSNGYRNPYDMDFNADGELFAYDADMEWDFGTPWYRPTRVVHATSGSEFGWRSGTGKWPTYYPDSLPPVVNIGPGSPVGVEFGHGTRFPARFQRALFICDWTFGTMYSIHIEPDGASYRGTREEFLSRTPLPLTDVAMGHDGALYFTVGGRGTQSELYRVTYIGDEATDPAELHDTAGAELRALRHEIEALQGPVDDPAAAVRFLLPRLGHADRFIRYTARVALERQPIELWQDAVLSATDPAASITGAVGLARQASGELQGALLAALDRLDFTRLDKTRQLELARAYQLALIRLGPIDDETRLRLAAKFDALFPSDSPLLNRELATLLVALQAPTAAEKLVPYLTRERESSVDEVGELLTRNPSYGGAVLNVQSNPPDLQQLHYALALRNLQTGWTTSLRQDYFDWFTKARQWSGGASYMNFLKHIDEEAYDNCTDAERLAVEALGSRQPYQAPELPKPLGPGRPWTLPEVLALADGGIKGRSFENGKRTYAAARCVVCHRFGGEGGATGPDLTQLAGRFNLKDLTEAMTDPSKVISDQYKATIIVTTDGVSITGRVVSEDEGSVTLVVDPENSAKVVKIAKADIDERQPSAVSLMPKELFQTLNQDEVLDLLAYLLSRGNPGDAMFRP